MLGLLFLASVAAQDWTQFRGPDQGTSSEKGLPTAWSASKGIVWKTALPGPGSSSPILVKDRITLTAYSGTGAQFNRVVLRGRRRANQPGYFVPAPSWRVAIGT